MSRNLHVFSWCQRSRTDDAETWQIFPEASNSNKMVTICFLSVWSVCLCLLFLWGDLAALGRRRRRNVFSGCCPSCLTLKLCQTARLVLKKDELELKDPDWGHERLLRVQQSVSRVGGACSHPIADPCSVCVCVWCVYCLIDDLTSVFLINLSKRLICTPYWPLGVLQKKTNKTPTTLSWHVGKAPFYWFNQKEIAPPHTPPHPTHHPSPISIALVVSPLG